MKTTELTDQQLIDALLSNMGGAINAYETIFHRYYPMVLNFIKGMLKDHVLSEDVAQDVFMKLWINRAYLNKEQSLKNYLCVLARNKVLDILKSKSKKSTLFQPQMPELCSNWSGAEDWMAYSETNLQFQKDLEAMPPQRRAVFMMSRYENMTNMEIAVKLNLSVRTVAKHMELALKQLRKSIN